MGWFVLLGVASLLLMYLAQRISQDNDRSDDRVYSRNNVLFSPAERSFLEVLEQAIGDTYRIFGKVHVASVASVSPQTQRGGWRRAYDRIRDRHFDYVLCDIGDLTIAAIVELDDSPRRREDGRGRGEFPDNLCRSIELPLIRFIAQRAYSIHEVRARILSAIKAEDVESGYAPVSQDHHGPRCPKCEAPMVLRQATTRDTAGKPFWGCSNYPECWSILPFETG